MPPPLMDPAGRPTDLTSPHARRIGIFVVGCARLMCDVVMLVTAGPAGAYIFAGLSLLAIEFV